MLSSSPGRWQDRCGEEQEVYGEREAGNGEGTGMAASQLRMFWKDGIIRVVVLNSICRNSCIDEILVAEDLLTNTPKQAEFTIVTKQNFVLQGT